MTKSINVPLATCMSVRIFPIKILHFKNMSKSYRKWIAITRINLQKLHLSRINIDPKGGRRE